MPIDVTFLSVFLAFPGNAIIFLRGNNEDEAVFHAEELTRDQELDVFTREPIMLEALEIEDINDPAAVVDALEEAFILASSAHGPKNGAQIVFGTDGAQIVGLAYELGAQINKSALVPMTITGSGDLEDLMTGQALRLSVNGDHIAFTLYTELPNDDVE